jgi:hypothetical protein
MKNFLILAQPRSGTNTFVAKLNAHPSIACHYEVFHPNAVYLHTQKLQMCNVREDQLNSVSTRDNNPLKFLNSLLELSQSFFSAFGFKMFHSHAKTLRENLCKNKEWYKIIIQRSNLLDQFISDEIAKQTGRYNYYDTKQNPGEDDGSIVFSKSRFLKFVSVNRQIFEEYRTISAGPLLEIDFFEAISGNYSRIFDFLGLPDSINPTNIVTKKQNPTITKKKVKNFSYLEDCLNGTELEWMINK